MPNNKVVDQEPGGGICSKCWRSLRSVGPALIVACVVLGPGSILTSSQVGCQFAYQLLWVLAAAGLLMAATLAAASFIGITLEGSPCTELAKRIGRPAAVLVGVSVFCIASCFQFSNNLGVLASIEPLAESTTDWQPLMLVAINTLLIICLFGFKHLYLPIEKLMMFLVGMMLVGFAVNLYFAHPSLLRILSGFLPSIPAELTVSLVPQIVSQDTGEKHLADGWIAVQGLVVTTFSVAGAFYQAYLVKEKGWTHRELKEGLFDSMLGTFVLVGISMLIMATSATVLAGRVEPGELRSAADVALQLEPLFGVAAKWLFCLGIFAGAISSFLVNSMIGGTLMADGLGFDPAIDSKATKVFTAAVLVVGMLVALGTDASARVPLIIFAQAMTVLGGPLLILTLVYLMNRIRVEQHMKIPLWISVLTLVGAFVVVALAIRTAWRITLTLQI